MMIFFDAGSRLYIHPGTGRGGGAAARITALILLLTRRPAFWLHARR